MKPDLTQQEILLVANTTFFKRQLCETGTTTDSQLGLDAFEEACWNGMLDELAPEIIHKPAPGHKLFLWETRKGQAFLQIVLSEIPLPMEKEFSIDPNVFESTLGCN